MELVAADPQLPEEQERLDRTFALWDKVGPPAARERFRDRLADRVATEVMARSAAAGRADPETVLSAVRRTREFQKLASGSWPRQMPEALVAQLFKNRRRLTAVSRDLFAAEEIDLLLATPPAKGAMTHGEFAVLDEARALIDPELAAARWRPRHPGSVGRWDSFDCSDALTSPTPAGPPVSGAARVRAALALLLRSAARERRVLRAGPVLLGPHAAGLARDGGWVLPADPARRARHARGRGPDGAPWVGRVFHGTVVDIERPPPGAHRARARGRARLAARGGGPLPSRGGADGDLAVRGPAVRLAA